MRVESDGLSGACLGRDWLERLPRQLSTRHSAPQPSKTVLDEAVRSILHREARECVMSDLRNRERETPSANGGRGGQFGGKMSCAGRNRTYDLQVMSLA